MAQEGPREQQVGKRAPLEEDELVVLVPRGLREKLVIEEMDPQEATSEITVRVSRKRKTGSIPVVGVIVK
jgi:hypothetical protein